MDNFENQDLGGLPILKKETPSQEKDLGGLPILKKKEPTPLGFSVTPLQSQDKFKKGLAMAQSPIASGLAMAQSPIASAVKKDTQKDENLAAGIYNTLVGSVKRLAGGVAYAGEVFLGGRPEATITRLAGAENARQKTEQFVEKARSEKSSKQYEEAMGKYDFTPKPGGGLFSGVDADDFKALAFTAPSQALDMVLGGLTYGSSFVAQSVSDAANELNQSDSGKKLNDAQKATYIFTQAAVQAALEKVSLDLILKNTGLGKVAKQKIANEITDEFVKKGVKATAEEITEAAIKKASTFANQAKRVGIKAAAGVATEGATEGTQTAAQEGIKLLTNKIVDKDVFNEEDIIANLGKNIINSSIGGAAFGSVAGGGVGLFQNTNKAIRDEVAKAGKKYFVNETEVSEAEFNAATGNKKVVSDITKIQDEISKQVEEGNITPQEAQAANITAQQYAEIAGKIPTTVSPQDKYKIIGGIEQREALNARKQQAYDELTTLDPVFRKEKQDQIDLIQAKIDETNDYLEGIVSGKKPEYKEKRGMYFKVDSEGNETPINKETYDLATSIRDEDKIKEKQQFDQFVNRIVEGERMETPEDLQFYENNKTEIEKALKTKAEETKPAVVMPEEIAPQVVEPSKGPAVIMPQENVPAETTVISPEQQGKGAAVIMPEANVAPKVAETVVTEEVKPTEETTLPTVTVTGVRKKPVTPEVKSKLESFKTKFAPQPKEVSVSAVSAAQKRVNRQEAAKIAPTDARGFALSWMNQSPDVLDWNSIKDLFGGRRARLNVKEATPEEIAKRDYVAEKEGDEKAGKNGVVKGIDDVVNDIWNNLPEGLEDRITTRDIKDELEALISEYPTRAEAARALIQHEGGLKGKSIEEQQLAFEERRGMPSEINVEQTFEGYKWEGGFVPFEEDIDIEGMEEPPFAVQEATTEELEAMQDIVKDYINEGVTSLSEIKKAIAKELGYNTKKLRQTIDDAYNNYTKTKEAAPKDVVGGVIGRTGNALKNMFGKDAQKPFIAKDSKAMQAKLDEIREDVKFQIAGGFRGTNDMPVAYRYDTDQVARERFDIPNLKQIGAGSDRVVFDLGDGKVLKVAKTPRGLEQNIYEGDYYLSGSIIPESFERGLNYVVVEKIDPPLKATKGFDKLNDLLNRIQKFSQKDFDQHNPDLQEVIEEYEMSDIFNYDLLWNDFKAKRNWGLKDGQPLHLDGGSFGGIRMLDKFKGQKPLSDPEFRDIYNRSKKAKIENKDVDKFTKFMANDADAESDFTADDIKKYKTLAGFDKYGSRYNAVRLSEMGVDKSITNAKQFADKLAEVDGPFKGILKAIAKTPGLDKVRFEIVDGYIINGTISGSAAGTYGPDPENLATWVWENNGKLLRVGDTKENTYYTGTHELMHWVTIDSIMADTKSQDYKALEKIYTFIRSNDKFKDLTTDNMWGKNYGLFNFKEFMAEILINPEFRENIGEITAANKEEFLKGFEKGSNFGKDFDESGLGVAIYNAIVRAIEKMLGTYGDGIDFDKSLMDNAVDLSIKTFLKSGNTPSKINFMADENAEIIGFTYNNRMYLNGSILNPNTPIHEAGHIWVEWTKTNDPKIYAKGMELVKDSPYYNKAKESKFYQKQANNLPENQREDYYSNEALAMAIGDKGAQFVVESKREAFKDWLKTLWNKIKSLTGFKDLTEEQFQNLTFEEFSKMAVKEILGVENDLDKFQAVRSMKKKKDFVKGKVRGEANKRAIDDFEVDDMVKLIKADYDLQTLKNIKDAIQKRSAEEVLPSQPRKTREARGERKRVEPRVEGDEAAGEGEDAQPEGIEKDWEGAITIAANEERRQMLGLPEYERERQTFEQWTNSAIRSLKRGYNVEKLLDKIVNQGYSPSPEENQIRKIYIAKLKSDYDANPTAELEKKLIRYTQLNDIVNSQIGRQLRSLADVSDPRETLADFVVSKMRANLVDELTDEQRSKVEKQYNEIKKAQEEADIKFKNNSELNAKLLAEDAFEEQKKVRKPYQKTKDYKSEKKSVIDSIKQKWKEKGKPSDVLLATPVPLPITKIKQLTAIAPDVNKLMNLYIEEGVDTLAEVVSKIYVDLRNEIDDLVENDIFDIIAGKYKKQKPPLTGIQLKKIDLKEEARLISEIQTLLAGEMPKNEKLKIERNQRIVELRNQSKELKKELGVLDLAKLNALKEKNERKIQELDEKIKNGDFEKEPKPISFLENPEFIKKYPEELNSYYDSKTKLLDKKYEYEVSLIKDEMSKYNLTEKIYKKYYPEFTNTLKAILTTLDNSYILVQLYPEVLANPLLLPKILNEQRKVIFNEGRFNREIVALHEDKKLWDIIEKSGLDVLDPKSFREKLRDESMGATNLLERQIKIGDKKIIPAKIINAPFERIATAAGNYVRMRAFMQIVTELESKGRTIENSEKIYKDYARVLNEMSGRGKLPSVLENQSGIVSAFIWAPRMMASSFNLLGIGDFVNFVLGKKGYYRSLDKEVKNFALKRMARATSTAALIMLAFSLNDDYEVDYDPRSTGFGNIKNKKTGVSDNVGGRFAPILKFFVINLPYMGYKMIQGEPVRADILKENYKFLRGKAAPFPGVLADLYMGENLKGDPVSIQDLPKELLTPLGAREVNNAMEEEGVSGIFRAIKAIHGMKITTEKMYNQALQPVEDVIKKHARTEFDIKSFELKDPKTGEIASDEQYEKFVKQRDELIAQNLKELYGKYVITNSPNPVPFVTLEAKDASEEITAAKTKATKEAKEIVFGKKKKTAMERLIERKRRMLRR